MNENIYSKMDYMNSNIYNLRYDISILKNYAKLNNLQNIINKTIENIYKNVKIIIEFDPFNINYN
jgi:hypothetical protein